MQAQLCKWIIATSLCVGVSACNTNGPQLVRSRDNVTYYDAHHPGPDRKHEVDVKPEPVGGMRTLISRLDYPRDLRHKRVTGVVWVGVSIDADGHVTSAKIVQS